MKKAYVTYNNFNNQAKEIIENAGIEVTENNTNIVPNGDKLIKIFEQYDIIITGVFSKYTKEILKTIKSPKILASISVGLDHIDKSFFESQLVKVVNIETANAISVAEHIFSLILSLNKRIYESNNLAIQGKGYRNNVHERPDDITRKNTRTNWMWKYYFTCCRYSKSF